MSREPSLRLEDILAAAATIEEYLEGYDYDSFVEDRRTVDAVTRNLEIIGESRTSVSEFYLKRSEMAWTERSGVKR